MNEPTMLDVKDLSVTFDLPGSEIEAVRQISFAIERGETLALVGESGSGKSVTALSVMKLLPYPVARHPGGSILFDGEELIDKAEGEMRVIRGNRVAMIFQEPLNSLNPLQSIEKQIREVLEVHKRLSPAAAKARVEELLDLVGMSEDAGMLAGDRGGRLVSC